MELHRQMCLEESECELLLIDDASTPEYSAQNNQLAELKWVKHQMLPENIGRSRIRNLLAIEARFPYLVFLDCDSELPDNLFVKRYLQELPFDGVVCGGRSYSVKSPGDNYILHWRYGMNRETTKANQRSHRPYHSFMSNNFMVARRVVLNHAFNEQLTGYGHEDTLFGYELKKNLTPILHIENPLLHKGLDTNREFLLKTVEGIKNLAFIYNNLQAGNEFARTSKLLTMYIHLRHWKLTGVVALIFRWLKNPIEQNLLGRNPNLLLLDFYKLGVLIHHNQAS